MEHNLMINNVYSLPAVAAMMAALLPANGAAAQSEFSDVADTQRSQPPYEYTLEYAQHTFDRDFKSEQYLEAIDAGKLAIKLLLEQEDLDNMRWSQALRQLASAQRHAGKLVPAIQNYKTAIRIIESKFDRLNPNIVDPLWELSQTYVDAGDFKIAASTYERTLHTFRVNNGLNNVEQMVLLAEMSEVYFQLDDYVEANSLQKFRVNLAKLNYPGTSLGKLPALYEQADMMTRTGANLESQVQYRRIIRLIEKAEGRRSLTLLPVLYKMADVLFYHEILDGYNGPDQARRYLRRAVRIAEKHRDASNLQKSDAHLAMGDYFSLISADRTVAVRSYRKAWDWLTTDNELRAERDNRFAAPVALNDVPSNSSPLFLDLKANADADTDKNGVVIVNYDVNRRGKVANIQVRESFPPGHKEDIVLRHLRGIVFRPRFAEGEPVNAVDRRYEIRYSFRDEELPKAFRETVAESAASNDVEP